MSDPTTVEVLQRAKDLLIEQGWIQGSFTLQGSGLQSDYAASCAVGAIQFACVNSFTWPTVARRLLQQVVGQDVPQWNDHPTRTFADVMDAFDAAILLAKEQEAHA